ncbi:MAG: hypothetical protein QXO03_00155 [Thermoplasmatales archaeon]
MQEATGADLRFVFEYVKQRRGMNGVRTMLAMLNRPSIVFGGIGEISRSQLYPEAIYKKVIETAANVLGGDPKTRLNQIGYALGDRAKMTKFIAKFSTQRQLVRLIEDAVITDVPYVKTALKDASKHIIILTVSARKDGNAFLDVADGYITALLDQSNRVIAPSEKKVGEEEISYKFVVT